MSLQSQLACACTCQDHAALVTPAGHVIPNPSVRGNCSRLVLHCLQLLAQLDKEAELDKQRSDLDINLAMVGSVACQTRRASAICDCAVTHIAPPAVSDAAAARPTLFVQPCQLAPHASTAAMHAAAMHAAAMHASSIYFLLSALQA